MSRALLARFIGGDVSSGIDVAAVERDAKLSAQLEMAILDRVLTPFHEAHPDAALDVPGAVLLQMASVRCMASIQGMDPDAFAALARDVALDSLRDAIALREKRAAPAARGERARNFAIKLRYELKGAHVHTDVFVGERVGSFALTGQLIMRPDEWLAFESVLWAGAPRVPDLTAVVLTESKQL